MGLKGPWPVHHLQNTIHLPDNRRSVECQCGTRAVYDAGTCVMCGRRITLEHLIRYGRS